MPRSPRLSPSSQVILGILAATGPQTPYAIKQIVARTVGNYWPFPHAQIYAETTRLGTLGLVTEEQEPTGLRRKRYAITADGRAALEDWLTAKTPDPAQFRDLGLLKLAFASLAPVSAVRAVRDDQIAAHEARLATFERYALIPMDPFLRATLELGLHYERAALAFWQGLDPDELATADSRTLKAEAGESGMRPRVGVSPAAVAAKVGPRSLGSPARGSRARARTSGEDRP